MDFETQSEQSLQSDTAREIAQQPALWLALAEALDNARSQLEGFLGDATRDPRLQLVFTGAGSSGFLAEMAAGHATTHCQASAHALHSTTLLTHPENYLKRDQPTLLVSFGRSGSSPESVATVDLVRTHVEQARFLDITCNADGELARRGHGRDDTLTLLMPPASCDRAFAMTSSLTCMLLTALTAFDSAPWPQRIARLSEVAALGQHALAVWEASIAQLAQEPHRRVIVLGSGPLEPLAKESALKLLELTAGRVLALANTPLGFRHGPKAALDGDTLVLMLRSVEPLARRYEQDLLDELRSDGVAAKVIAVGPQLGDAAPEDLTLAVPALSDLWLAPVWLTVAQRYALHRSIALGLTPDNPFPDGTVNRVVQGVMIHKADAT